MALNKSISFIITCIGIGIFVLTLIMLGKAAMQDIEIDPIESTTGARAAQNNTYMDTATYIGSSECGSCHSAKHTDWSATLHTKMIQSASTSTVLGDFSGSWLNLTIQNGTGLNKNVSIWIEKVGPDYQVMLVNGTDPADKITHVINSTLGSKWKQRYMIDIGNNTYILPIQWNPPTSEWVGYRPEHWFDVDGSDFNGTPVNATPTASWEKRCAACHTTGFEAVYNDTTGEYKETYVELNVGCEACHGPGSLHKTPPPSEDRKDYIWKSVTNEVCGQCHNRGHGLNDTGSGPWQDVGYPYNSTGRFMLGEDLDDYFVSVAFTPGTNSGNFWADNTSKIHRMQYIDYEYTSGKGKMGSAFLENMVLTDAECQHCMATEAAIQIFDAGNHPADKDTITTPIADAHLLTCVACHDTHSEPNDYQLRLPREELCSECHRSYPSDGPGKIPKRNNYQLMTGNINGTISGDPLMDGGVTCADCHMPLVQQSGIAYDLHSHTMKFMDPAESLMYPGIPNSCNVACHGGFNTGSEAVYNDTEAANWMTTLKSDIAAKRAIVDGNVTLAEAALDKYDYGYNMTAYSEAMTKYEELKWIMDNLDVDPSHGIHNPGYTMDLLDRADELATEIMQLDLGAYFIGSSECSTCHSDKYNTWKDTAHAKKFLDVASATIIGDFTIDPTLNSTANSIPNVTFDLTETGGVYTVKMNDTVTYTIDHVIGKGVWKQRYVVKLDQSFYVLPIQWNVETQEWVAYHIEDWYDTSGNLKTIGVTRSWDKRCGGCHTTGYSVTMDKDTGEYIGSYIEGGIACEACHGPGSLHKTPPSGEDRKDYIVKSVDSNVCGQCHARGTSENGLYGYPWSNTMGRTKPDVPVDDFWVYQAYTPGTNSGAFWANNNSVMHRQQYIDFTLFPSDKGNYGSEFMKGVIFSTAECQHCHATEVIIQVFDEGKHPYNEDTITTPMENGTVFACAACHDTHSTATSQLRLPKDELCIECHITVPGKGPGSEVNSNEHNLTAGKVYGVVQGTPMMGSTTCADCHMPSVAKSAVAYDIASHTFKFISPENSIRYGMPNSCTVSCHSGMTDEAANNSVNYWMTTVKDRAEEVHVKLLEAEEYVMGLDSADAEYDADWDKYNKANWSYMNAAEDVSHGVHNFDYSMELLNYSMDMINDLIGGGIISGKITDKATGDPIEGAKISVGAIYTMSGSDGSYELTNAPAGTGMNVTVDDVMYYGYKQYSGTYNASVDVEMAKTVTVNFMLMEEALPVAVIPKEDSMMVKTDDVITVTFIEDINFTSFNITVMAGSTEVAGNVTYDSTNYIVTFTPEEELSEDTEYTVTVDKDVMGTDNDPILWKDKIWKFTTTGEFAVTLKVMVGGTSTTVTPGLTGVNTDTTFTLIFPFDIDPTTITVKLSGSISLTQTSYDNTTYTAVYTPASDLEGAKEHTLTLGSGFKDADGNMVIDADMIWTFTTKSVSLEYDLELGPFVDEDNKAISGAKVTVTVGGTDYTGTTGSDGKVTITLPTQPSAGSYSVKIEKDGYDDLEFDVNIADDGTATPDSTDGSYPQLKAEEEPSNMLMWLAIIIIIVIVVLMVAMLMRKKKPEEEEEEVAEEEGEEAGEFECPSCGAVVTSEEKVCPECGSELEEEAFKCPECSAEIEADATTCEECGAEFEPAEEEGEELEEDEVEDEELEEGEEDEELLEDEEGEELEESEELDEEAEEQLLDDEEVAGEEPALEDEEETEEPL